MRFALAIAALLAATPALSEPAPEPPAEAVVGVLPFEASEEPNRVMVNLAPEGGRPFVMLLDTGASDSVMTPLMARALGVRVRKLKADPYRRPTRLGRDLPFWVDTRRSDTGSTSGSEFGVLGAEFLNDFVLEIDFPGRAVRFLDPQRYAVPAQVDDEAERVVPLKLTSSRPIVPVRADGRELTVILDTGAPVPGVLSGAAARELGVDVDALPALGGIGMVSGGTEARLLDVPSFELAGVPLGPTGLLVAPRGLFNMGAGNDSLVGYDALAPFVVRIDYPRKRLWLRRMSAAPIGFLGGDYALARRTGAFIIEVAGRRAVWRVLPGSAAERRGVRAGDVIVSPPDEVQHRVLDGGELKVRRKQGERWVDTVLPEPQATD